MRAPRSTASHDTAPCPGRCPGTVGLWGGSGRRPSRCSRRAPSRRRSPGLPARWRRRQARRPAGSPRGCARCSPCSRCRCPSPRRLAQHFTAEQVRPRRQLQPGRPSRYATYRCVPAHGPDVSRLPSYIAADEQPIRTVQVQPILHHRPARHDVSVTVKVSLPLLAAAQALTDRPDAVGWPGPATAPVKSSNRASLPSRSLIEVTFPDLTIGATADADLPGPVRQAVRQTERAGQPDGHATAARSPPRRRCLQFVAQALKGRYHSHRPSRSSRPRSPHQHRHPFEIERPAHDAATGALFEVVLSVVVITIDLAVVDPLDPQVEAGVARATRDP